MGNKELTQERLEEELEEELPWPQYYVSGDTVDAESDIWVPAYYKLYGPNGPIEYLNPDGSPTPTTTFDIVAEAQRDDFRKVPRDQTPWPGIEEED